MYVHLIKPNTFLFLQGDLYSPADLYNNCITADLQGVWVTLYMGIRVLPPKIFVQCLEKYTPPLNWCWLKSEGGTKTPHQPPGFGQFASGTV